MTGPYDDILHLPHHRSSRHPALSPLDRAAQFSPFAALTGHSDAIRETARTTDARIQLDEDRIAALDQALFQAAQSGDRIAITYFQPDAHKDGGAYVEVRGRIRRVYPVEGVVSLEDGPTIPLADMFDIQLCR